ncbi:MAG: IS982 family transposase, partial [Streptococcus alactolyticus]|nr:IS982 family transposase [Streptococcus alactolyticus]MDD7362286.1 IS982 family transposase [Streptococcus alactolyticus]
MSHLQYTAKSHHLQWDMKPLKQFCTLIYRQY